MIALIREVLWLTVKVAMVPHCCPTLKTIFLTLLEDCCVTLQKTPLRVSICNMTIRVGCYFKIIKGELQRENKLISNERAFKCWRTICISLESVKPFSNY